TGRPMTSAGELTVFHYLTRQPVRVRWREGTITQIEPTTTAPSDELWVAPTLFDVQVNGYGGVDFQQDRLVLDDLLVAARELRAAGCARFLLTLITDEWSKLAARLRHLRALRSKSK